MTAAVRYLFYAWLDAILAVGSRLLGSELRTGIALARLCDKEGRSFDSKTHAPTVPRLVERTGLCRNTVIAALSGLERKGIIRVERRSGFRTSYELASPDEWFDRGGGDQSNGLDGYTGPMGWTGSAGDQSNGMDGYGSNEVDGYQSNGLDPHQSNRLDRSYPNTPLSARASDQTSEGTPEKTPEGASEGEAPRGVNGSQEIPKLADMMRTAIADAALKAGMPAPRECSNPAHKVWVDCASMAIELGGLRGVDPAEPMALAASEAALDMPRRLWKVRFLAEDFQQLVMREEIAKRERARRPNPSAPSDFSHVNDSDPLPWDPPADPEAIRDASGRLLASLGCSPRQESRS